MRVRDKQVAAGPGTAVIELRGLGMRYGDQEVLSGVDLSVAEGEFVSLLGPSGCGKTTTIRIVAGYVKPTAGRVVLDGRDVTDAPPQRRNTGMVFQNYALFPHMTVRENVAFGLRMRKVPRAECESRAAKLLGMVRLEQAAEMRPAQLSGGMQQRVAVARALAFGPRILLMDEPLAALDANLRASMQEELKRLQSETGVTTIYVTHDREEAFSLSDRIVIMNEGTVVQIGTPQEIYHAPSSVFAADFVGTMNKFPVHTDARRPDALMYRVHDEHVQVEEPCPFTGEAHLGVRPEAVRIVREPQSNTPNAFRATVESAVFRGSWTLLTVTVPGLDATVRVDAREAPAHPGEEVWVSWEPSSTRWLRP